ncbi:hypothetical protein PTNB73_06917 [Pyrenophora teres f. teres]|nr:hypothetical protein HRS9122_10009 [Pyrenophora teres f. teres]KAE8828462.1 hypothetical protein HRS9139_07681 [Pyrenophora teres f. teres]KAE8831063.1 hypothetical protein PTNB85_07650 [Pyrenophora teres f. teres]KAE8863710.1 hypothetical protein PTNB73_06917 [Pyrenophora teres f. teres]CAA9963421.1 mitochondrial metalloendopeptidase OMA1 [Pyrenophora teres f. maculata]
MYRIRPRFCAPRSITPSLRNHAQIRWYNRIGGRGPQYKRFSASNSSYTDLLYRWAASPTFYRDVGIITAGSGGIYLYNLEEVPVSGRRRFNIIPPSLEAKLSESTVAQIKEEYKGRILPENDYRVQQVRRVLERLLPFAEGEGVRNVNWEVNVIDSPEQNAESLTFAPFILLGCLVLAAYDVSMSTSSAAFNFFLQMPASRKHEAEADYIGLLMMAQGCYRPEAAASFWARMEKQGGQPPELLSTHPSHHNREAKIREWLPKAQEKAEASDCHITAQYATHFSSAFENLGRW